MASERKEEEEQDKRVIYTYPMVKKSDMTDEMKADVMEICTNVNNRVLWKLLPKTLCVEISCRQSTQDHTTYACNFHSLNHTLGVHRFTKSVRRHSRHSQRSSLATPLIQSFCARDPKLIGSSHTEMKERVPIARRNVRDSSL